jgi:general secretion pathway protein D
MSFRLLVLCLFTLECLADDRAAQIFKDGQAAEKAGKLVEAYICYAQAAAMEPKNITYGSKAQAVRPRAMLQAERKKIPNAAVSTPASLEDDGPRISTKELQEARQALPPPLLELNEDRRDFDIRGDSRALFEKLTADCGITPFFDLDYQPTPALRFQVNGVSCREALRVAEDAGNSFVVPLSTKKIMIARDSQQKRAELEPNIVRIFPIPQRTSVQEAQELSTAIQQIFEVRHIMVDPQKRLILMRDRYSKVTAAGKILEDLALYRPQVTIEVQLISVSDSSALGFGLQLPSSFPVVNFSSFLHSSAGIPAGFTKFLTFGGGLTTFGIGVTDAGLFATLTKTSAKNILTSQVTTTDGLPASLHVGQKYPVVTGGYYGTTTGTGQVFSPPPTVNFEDLGLVLKITPTVHSMDEVSLEIESEFKELSGGALNGIPIIANRKYQGRVRLMAGEWCVVAGLMNASETRTFSGIIGGVFGSHEHDTNNDRTLLVIKPHIMSLPPGEHVTQSVWIGTDTRPRSLSSFVP